MNETVIAIDFETTGLSPARGARAIEVAAVRMTGNRIIDSYQSLINPGVPVPDKITQITGISDAMVRKAPPAMAVMARLSAFIGSAPLVAHNAKFDAGFLEGELHRISIRCDNRFACTLQLARRLYPRAPNFKLATVLDFAGVAVPANMHRAHADAAATAELWLQMKRDLAAKSGLVQPAFETMRIYGNDGRMPKVAGVSTPPRIVACPACGQKLRVPSGRLLRITCASCRRSFEK